MHRLEGAAAVVVDATTGTGPEVVRALLAKGARVVVPQQAAPHGDAASSGTSDEVPHGVTVWPGDVDGRDGIESFLGFAVEQLGHLDVVVLSAEDVPDSTLAALDEGAWSAATQRLDGIVWGLRASLGHMVPRGQGRVVVTMSADAKVGRADAAAGVAVAHAAYGLVKAAAAEAGPHGVTVNAVMGSGTAPGSLFGRPSAPEHVAGAVVLLAAPDGGGMSGVAFPVDGGAAPY